MSKQHVVLCTMAHIAVLVVVFLSGGVNAIYDECYFDADDSYQACEPTIEDVINTGNFTFTVYPANITCGTPLSQYRRLGDRFDSYLNCNATSQDPAVNHQPNYMVDGDPNSWWQSVTMATTRRLQVNVTLSFGKLYQLEGDIIITFNSGRPEKMILEKSADGGIIWSPLQYYARSCTEFYALGAGYEVTVDNLAKVICDNTSVESSTRPRPGGKAVFPVMSKRLQPLLPNQTNFEDYYRRRDTETGLAEFLIFTDLRLRLLEPATDGRQNYDMYYYAISDLEVIARCYCHLHASSCGIDSNNQSVCQCAHNTAGRDCEKCQPLYNERPWQKGRYSPFDTGSANECKKCECNDHAMSCVYDPQYGRGVCENCQHNTTSRHCELCLPGFYPNDTLPLSDTRRCIECGCEPLGSTDGNCSQAANLTVPLGQCACKPLVTGRRCDQCYPGFWGLMEPDLAGVCKPCDCDPDGTETGKSECAQTDGQCSCKPTVSNRTCNICADGYYDFPTNVSGLGCLPCKCDAGGAVNPVCEKLKGVCTCKTFIGGTKCDQVQPDYFLPALDDVIYQPQSGCNLTSDLWTTDNPFDGAVFASCDMMTDVQLRFEPIVGTMKQLHISWPYYIGVRYTMFEPAAVQTGTITLSVSGNSGANITGYGFDNSSCPIQQGVSHSPDVTLISGHSRAWLSENASVFLDVRCRYDVTLSLSAKGHNSAAIRLDSFILLPYLSAQIGEVQRMFQVLLTNDNKTEVETTYRACVEQLAALTSRDLALHSNQCAIFMSMSAELYGGAKACGCDPRGSEPGSICAALGGQCHCKTGVAGRKCDTCKPGYFNYTENGCTPCDCNNGGALNGACDYVTGQCTCKPNVATAHLVDTSGLAGDRKCSECRQNFYGIGRGTGCLPCECHVTGSTSQQCEENGQCPCVETVQGLRCDECKAGFFGFGSMGCSACACNVVGSLSAECNRISGSCTCKKNVQGEKCDSCKPAYFNLAPYHTDGCQPCFCFQHGQNCTSAPGFIQHAILSPSADAWPSTDMYYLAPEEFTGNKHVSYGQLIQFSFRLQSFPRDLANVTWILLQGDEGKILRYVSDIVVTITNTSGNLAVRLVPDLWKREDDTPVDAQEMLRVLADLQNLSLPKQVAGVPLTYSNVSMTTALLGNLGNEAQYVELCACDTASNVAGLSCEECAVGHRRMNTELTSRYQVCTACNCSGRALTTPPLCDQWNGTCTNCRNGSQGVRCQDCAPHVQGEGCSDCQDEFWGLSKVGCVPCNCSHLGSTSSVCNKVTGQCTCASFVMGARCDVCADNFYNLSSTGCKECDKCYSLVMAEVISLQALRDNLTSSSLLLEAHDVTPIFGLFVPRLTSAIATSQQLITFLDATLAAEDSVRGQIANLTFLVQGLSNSVMRLAGNATPSMAANLALTSREYALGATSILKTEDNVHNLVAQLNIHIGFIPRLASLSASLSDVEEQLRWKLNTSQAVEQSTLLEVQTLETTVGEVNSLAQQAIRDVQSSLIQHQNNTRRLTDLESADVTLTALAVETIAEARDISASSIEAKQSAKRLQSGLATIGPLNIDIDAISRSAANVTVMGNQLKTQTNRTDDPIVRSQEEISQAIALTESLRENVQNVLDDVRTMTTQVTSSERQAQVAQQDTASLFIEAETMLQTMKDFREMALDLERTTNSSLTNLDNIRAESANITGKASLLMSSVSTSQQTASQALSAARQANSVAEKQYSELVPIEASAKSLAPVSDAELDGVNKAAQTPEALLASVVFPANATCTQLQQNISGSQAMGDAVVTLGNEAARAANSASSRATTLLSTLRAVPNVDASRIRTLQAEVNSVHAQFNSPELTSTVEALRTNSQELATRITYLSAKKAELQAKVHGLRAVQQQYVS